MKILVACEFSGTVRDAFIKKGHDAMSCDILEGEGERRFFKVKLLPNSPTYLSTNTIPLPIFLKLSTFLKVIQAS